jgi:hypothetical protein
MKYEIRSDYPGVQHFLYRDGELIDTSPSVIELISRWKERDENFEYVQVQIPRPSLFEQIWRRLCSLFTTRY